jgi:hypothetical protein
LVLSPRFAPIVRCSKNLATVKAAVSCRTPN